ncbi:MAG TPA: glycosyltransferase family 39 protein, partial [Bacillota bacterium]|nr:glycosyltransferase family 39 protein [Bacillota bacterium]
MNKNSWLRGGIQYLIPGYMILIGGLLVLVFRLSHESVYWDEGYAWAMSNHSFLDIIRYTIDWENHPPLFYLLLKLFRIFAGNSILAIRLFSAIGALALMSLGLGPIRRACGLKTGLIFSGLTLLTPALLSLAQDGRMYTWSAFFVTGTIIYAYLATTGGKRNDWVKLGIMTLGAAYIHYYAFLAVGLALFLLFIWIFFKNRRQLPPFFITMGAVFIGYLPWLPAFIKQLTAVRQDFWIPPITPSVIWGTLFFPYGEKFDSAPQLFIFKPYAFLVGLALILWGIRQGVVQKSKVNSLNLLSFAVYVSTFLAGIILSYIIRPIWISRYIAPVLGLFILSLAIGLSFIRRKSA